VISGSKNKVFVRAKGSQGEQRELDFTDEPLSEEQLTNSILRISRKVRNVYFLSGHNEYDIYQEGEGGLTIFRNLLIGNNIVSRSLMLGIVGRIPDDCDVLIVAGPKEHLDKDEIKVINDYLKNGGDALFLIENTVITTPDKPLTEEEKNKNPTLNEIFKDWGIKIANDIVVDLASHVSGDVGCPATRNYMSHREVVRDVDYTFYIRPRSISMRDDRPRDVNLAPFVLTASKEGSWGETNRMLDVKFDENIDRAGPVPIAFAIWKPKEEMEKSDTRMMVFTDADFLSDSYIGQYSNALMGLKIINWLSEEDYQVFLDKKDIKVDRLDLTSKQKRVVAVILFMMPVVIAVFGIIVWMRYLL